VPAPFAGLQIDFVGSFPDPLVFLSPELPEVAFIGRSNVGKSSLLNSLVGRSVARVSGSPGKTTLLNAYRLPTFYLVDLPGYGFARAGKAARAGYRSLVTRYLSRRPTLAGVVWLLDIRHPPSKDDREFQELLIESGRPVLAALTKADKLSRGQRAERVRALARELELPDDQMQPTSSHSGEGIAELAEALLRLAAPQSH
jgi:GTP-binding protein